MSIGSIGNSSDIIFFTGIHKEYSLYSKESVLNTDLDYSFRLNPGNSDVLRDLLVTFCFANPGS